MLIQAKIGCWGRGETFWWGFSCPVQL